jgi:gliding motility-associated protein GldE
LDEPPSQTFLEILLSDISFVVWLDIALILVSVAGIAFMSISESVFFSFKGNDIRPLESSNDNREKVVARLLTTPYALFTTIVILSCLLNSAIISAAALFAGRVSQINTGTFIGVIVTIACILCVWVVVIPKLVVNRNEITLARLFAGSWAKLLRIFASISSILIDEKIKDEVKYHVRAINVDEGLNKVLEKVAEDEMSTEDEREMLKGIVNFRTLTVKEVMRSRVDIEALDIELDFHELMDLINKSGFSRMPVYRNTIDRIEGLLYIKDLLPFIEQDENFRWQKLIRPCFFVPEKKKIDLLLRDFQKKRVHMALVVDEYGGTMGLITLEDLIEEIIGDINDEFDDVDAPFRKIDETTFVFEGKTMLHDFCKQLDVDVELFDEVKGDSKSLGGLILELINELPGVGKKISYEQFTFVIEAVDRKRIKRVRVHINEQNESN